MDAERAYKSIGSATEPFLSNMIRALHLMPWLNTAEDNERLAAAEWVKRNRKAYAAYVQDRRRKWTT